MKISILGGTGDLGEGLAIRWARKHEVIIGSRDLERAKNVAKEYAVKAASAYLSDLKGSIIGMENSEAAREAEVIVLSIPPNFIYEFLIKNKESFNKEALIISPIVPVTKKDGKFLYDPSLIRLGARSAAEEVSKILESKKVVSSFHTIPAKKLADPYAMLKYDLLYCAEEKDAIDKFLVLVKDLDNNLNPLYVGDLELSYLIESITATILNVSLNSKKWNLSIKFV